ncbi:MAG: hypothetical protein ACREK5_01690 [Gemmatimonadota bacterium]
MEERLNKLIDSEIEKWAKKSKRRVRKPEVPPGTAQRILDEVRNDRV